MKTKIGKKIGKSSQKQDGFCDSQTAVCELILKVGALEERVAYLEEKATFPISVSWTSCNHSGQPFYMSRPTLSGVVAQ
jgi:hypothetical protein